MFLIDKNENRISKLTSKSFSELGFREREHLQEWIANNPDSIGGDLLIIQKEFSGFNDTNERLDLLALDREGNLVVIENKLDDSGKDVTWQSLKYASYCSTLSTSEIIRIYQDYLGSGEDAEKNIRDFLTNEDNDLLLNKGLNSQRIILVAANYRKEVTSTVLWLANFGVRIQCFKASPFILGEQLFLSLDQVLPIKDAEEYTISMTSKVQEEEKAKIVNNKRSQALSAFWADFLAYNKGKTDFYQNSSPSTDNWLGAGIGVSGLSLNIIVNRNHSRCELYFNFGDKELNKKHFEFFENQKSEVEALFGAELDWQSMPDKVTSRLTVLDTSLIYTDKESWPLVVKFLSESSARLYRALKPSIDKFVIELKSSK